MAYRGPDTLEKRMAGRIRAQRQSLGLSVKDVGLKIGITPSHYSHIEFGRRRPLPTQLQSLANLFGCSVAAFYDPPSTVAEAAPC